jgi:rubredoxin
MIEPHACHDCGEIYDEANGDGYCGLCPRCADDTDDE